MHLLRFFLLACLWLLLGQGAAMAVCSSYVGKATINEYNNLPSNSSFGTSVEIKLLDSTLNVSGWTLKAFSKTGTLLDSKSVVSSGVGSCPGTNYRVTPLAIASDGVAQLLDASGLLVDTLYVNTSSQPGPVSTNGCTLSSLSYPYTITGADSNRKNLSRDPDGTGNWIMSLGSGNNSEQTLCTSNRDLLSISKTASPNSVKIGETVTFTITVYNKTQYTSLTNISVTDVLPAGFIRQSASPSGSYSAGTQSWTVASLAPGASTTLTITAKASQVGTWTNTANASVSYNGYVYKADTATAPAVTVAQSLSLAKTVSPSSVLTGGNATFKVTVTNTATSGSLPAFTVNDSVPVGLVAGTASATFGSYAGGVWNIPDGLAAGASATLSLPVTGPVNGTYTNTATSSTFSSSSPLSASATLTVASALQASAFDACSNPKGTPLRCAATGNRLYTKLTGQDISFDLIALTAASGGSLDSLYGGSVKVDLVDLPLDDNGSYDGTTGACYGTTVKAGLQSSEKTIQFSGGYPLSPALYTYAGADNKTAARNVRVRFTQGSTVRCSSDAFAIRPRDLVLSGMSGTTLLSNGSLTGTPVLAAGATFTLVAEGGAGYSGKPENLVNTKVEPKIWADVAKTDYTDGLRPASGSAISFTGGTTAATADVQYHDYGRFFIALGAVVDKTFTDASGDIAGQDCIDNSSANDLSDDKKVGCYVANQSNTAIGRFAPDHFKVVASVEHGCKPAFTYMGQAFAKATLQVWAESQNLNLPLFRYDKTKIEAIDAGVKLAKVSFVAQSGSTPLTNRIAGWDTNFPWVAGVAGYSGTGLYFGRSGILDTPANPLNGQPDGPYDWAFRLTVSEEQDLCPGPAKCYDDVQVGPASLISRYGRIKLVNAYGSSNAPLRLPVQVEYWNGKAWVVNADDSTKTGTGCTALAGADVVVGDAAKGEATIAGFPSAVKVNATITAGVGSIFLPKPAAAGWANVALNLAGTASAPDQSCATKAATGSGVSLKHLRYAGANPAKGYWTCPAGAGGSDPWARATFGAARGAGQTIFQRENY